MNMTLAGGKDNQRQFLLPLTEPRQLWIIGWGRSGTNWLTRLFMDVLDIYDGATDGPTKPGVIGRLHWTLERPPGGKVCFIYRDPRDVIVSMKHFWNLPNIDAVLDPVDQPPLLPTMSEYWQAWLMDLEPEAVTRYERLLANPIHEMDMLLTKLWIVFDGDRLEPAVKRQTFGEARERLLENRPDRAKGLQFGTSGQWREVLNQEQGYKIDYWLGDWMHRMNYETDPDWWRGLPE